MTSQQSDILAQIQTLVQDYFESAPKKSFVPGESTVPLIIPSYSFQEVNQAVESLLTTRITLNQSDGNKVQQFEEAWSEYIGTSHGIMVNSGSSANLLALHVLANPATPNRIKPGDEVITPAVTWHTTVSPIIGIGAVPVLVDVRLDDCTIDVDAIEAEITPKTRAIMPVHLLGNPCQMDRIMDIAERHNLYVLEDTCEAHGSAFDGQRCGRMGHLGTFSFFFSHHITTMEGGMVVTSNDDFAELGCIMRSQGVIRNTKRRVELEAHYKSIPEYKDIDERYLFANMGFNLRPTELNGGFGIEQVGKIDGFLEQRGKNDAYWRNRLSKYDDLFYMPGNPAQGRAWFCFPIILKPGVSFTREDLVAHLTQCHIETRPIMSGNVAAQPAMKHFEHRTTSLDHAKLIHQNGFFWGNHQGIDEEQCAYVADCIDEFIAKQA